MRILMLGWEFPPFIAGGLGVACYGLARSLDARGHEITFVLPIAREEGRESTLSSPRVRVVSPSGRSAAAIGSATPREPGTSRLGVTFVRDDFERTVFRGVPVAFSSPYAGGGIAAAEADALARGAPGSWADGYTKAEGALASRGPWTAPPSPYAGDLFVEADRYARWVASIARESEFDIVHAHDWLSFGAGAAASAVLGCPWVAHVHSTEFDRSGRSVNQRICDIERRGLQGATRVVAVSQLTKAACISRYGVEPSKVDVVYNAVAGEGEETRAGGVPHGASPIGDADRERVVLFLGRVTMQKGPEYFLAAAKRVLEVEPRTLFLLAGSGDMDSELRALVQELGIAERVRFTGFLRGSDVRLAMQLADCFVMPSVSEPFGLVALEAAQRGVPVILSRQSGVSEVLQHVLKVDFWDTGDLANKIVAVLRSPGLSRTLVENNSRDVAALSWDTSAEVCERVYATAREQFPWPAARAARG